MGVEVDPERIRKRLETQYLDVMTDSLDEALKWLEEAERKGVAKSIGLVGNAAEVLPELVRRNFHPDLVTDQTSAHDPLKGYVPAGMTLAEALKLREADPGRVCQAIHAIHGDPCARHARVSETGVGRF